MEGLDVLVEKPLAGSVEDAMAIVKCAETYGRRVAVGFQAVWSPVVQSIVSMIHDGRIGEVQRIAISGVWPRPVQYYQRNAWAGKRYDQFGAVNDNPANNAFAHFLNIALLFAGPSPNRSARVLNAKSELLRVNEIQTFDTVFSYLSTDTEVDVFYGVSHASDQELKPAIVVVGTKGRVNWNHEGGCVLIDESGAVELPVVAESQAQESMIDTTMESAVDGTPFLFSAEDAMAHVEAVQQIEKGASEGVSYPDFELIVKEEMTYRVIPGIVSRIQSEFEGFLNI